jgi:hypothetical protein
VHPPASVTAAVVARQHHRDRRRLTLTLAAAGAALGTAAGVVAVVPRHVPTSPTVPNSPTAADGTRQAITLTADQKVLYQLSSAAARQPDDQGRYAVMSTKGADIKDTSVIDTRTGNMWSYQAGTDGSPSGKSFTRDYSPTEAQFAAMPTDPAALRAVLVTQWDNANKPVPNPLWRKVKGRPTPVPLPLTVSANDKVFQQASDILWNPLVGPALRSALYRVLAMVPGVRVATTHDSLGRPAVELSRVDSSGLPGGKSDGDVYATYESSDTGAVLESTVSYPPGSDVVTPQDPSGTSTVIDTTVYLSVTWASTIPADPYAG